MSRFFWMCLALALALGWLICLTGCGIRKSAVKVEDTTYKEKEKSTSEGSVKKESSGTENTSNKEKNSAVDENMKQKITELYDENGKLKSRITEFEKQKQATTSSKTQKSLKTYVTRVDSIFSNTNYRNIVITTHVKDKEVDADKSIVKNLGGWEIVLTLGIVGIGAVLLYFYLRRKSKGG